MQKVDKPKKPLLVYYLIALVAIILVNQVLFPAMVKQEVKEVDYGTFLTMLSDKTVAKVELSGDEIYFEDKSDNLYSTNTFEDADLVNRLQEAGCEFGPGEAAGDEPALKHDPLARDPAGILPCHRPAAIPVSHEEDGRRRPWERDVIR